LQLFKSNKKGNLEALSKALECAENQDSFLYLVRVCSKQSDFALFEGYISELPANDKIALLISLASRADRKNLKKLALKFCEKAEKQYALLPGFNKEAKLKAKLDLTRERLEVNCTSTKTKMISELSQIADKGNHTLAIYNTYGGNWNHPHFKSVFKASNLCAAFDLDLALINFPQISPGKLVNEIKKEMRLSNEGYIKLLIDKKRVQFFDNEIDEAWSGSVIATTANPDVTKFSLPNGRLCMVMGLGPKGLPKSFVSKALYHFELTGSNIAFETGTAMGAISAHLMKY